MIFAENNGIYGHIAAGKTVIISGRVNEELAMELSIFLTKNELERAKSYRDAVDQQVSIVIHGIKRLIISRILKVHIDELKFDKDDHGKPLCSNINAPIFNISHSNGFAAIAFKNNGAIGIDIEFPRDINYKELSKSVFNLKELRQYELQGFKNIFFVEAWAKKEAATKASGHGLYKSFTDIYFEKTLTDNVETTYIDEKKYTIFHKPFENGCLALASSQPIDTFDLIFFNY